MVSGCSANFPRILSALLFRSLLDDSAIRRRHGVNVSFSPPEGKCNLFYLEPPRARDFDLKLEEIW